MRVLLLFKNASCAYTHDEHPRLAVAALWVRACTALPRSCAVAVAEAAERVQKCNCGKLRGGEKGRRAAAYMRIIVASAARASTRHMPYAGHQRQQHVKPRPILLQASIKDKLSI